MGRTIDLVPLFHTIATMLQIDLRSKVPIVDQIYKGIRREIASGSLSAGQPLPTVRQLAGDLGISLNTVARAYRMLEKDGLATPIRGRGTVILDLEYSGSHERGRDRLLIEELKNLLTNARLAGWSQERLETVLARESRRLWTGEK